MKSVSELAPADQIELMCEVGRRIWQRGMCAGNEGNHSVRVGENRFLCTPTQMSKGFLRPDDLCVIDEKGEQIAGMRRRSSEVLLHLAIYRERPDVNAVVHAHPPHATAFAIAGVDLPAGVHPEAEVFLGMVPTAPYVTPGDHRLGESIVPFVKTGNTILLQSHGVVCFDRSLETAYYDLEVVESYSRILLLTKQIGSIRTFNGKEVRGLLDLKKRFGLSDARETWPDDKLEREQQGEFVKRVNGS